MKRALDRPFRPARPARRVQTGPAGSEPDETRAGSTVSSGSPGAGGSGPSARSRRPGRGARGARPRGRTPPDPIRAGTRQRHAGVSTHHGHPGTRRHTHPGPGGVCRLMTVMPGRVDTPVRRWRAAARPPARPGQGARRLPAIGVCRRGLTPIRELEPECRAAVAVGPEVDAEARKGVRPRVAAGPAPAGRAPRESRGGERGANPLPHRLTSGRSDHTRLATTGPRAERARPPETPRRRPPAAGPDHDDHPRPRRPPPTTTTTPDHDDHPPTADTTPRRRA
jgi:hypothetical protein